MTNDVKMGLEEKMWPSGALGRTRKLTRGVTVGTPVSYEALRFRAGKSGRSIAVYVGRQHGGHRFGKAYTGGERTVAQPGGNG